MTTRHAQVVGLRPELRNQYLELHDAVWPEVEAKITECNITNYTIFVLGDLLIAYFEYVGTDYEMDMARMAADPTTREWWTHTDPCQIAIPGAPDGAVWADAAEIWHLA